MAPPWLSVKLDVPADMATDDSEPSEVIKSVLELMEVGDYAPLLDRQDLSSEDWRRVVLEWLHRVRGWQAAGASCVYGTCATYIYTNQPHY